MLREGPFEGPASALRREMRRAEREEVEPQGTTHSVAVSPDELRVAVESPGSTRAQLGVPEHGTDRAEPGRIGSDLGGVDPTTDNPMPQVEANDDDSVRVMGSGTYCQLGTILGACAGAGSVADGSESSSRVGARASPQRDAGSGMGGTGGSGGPTQSSCNTSEPTLGVARGTGTGLGAGTGQMGGGIAEACAVAQPAGPEPGPGRRGGQSGRGGRDRPTHAEKAVVVMLLALGAAVDGASLKDPARAREPRDEERETAGIAEAERGEACGAGPRIESTKMDVLAAGLSRRPPLSPAVPRGPQAVPVSSCELVEHLRTPKGGESSLVGGRYAARIGSSPNGVADPSEHPSGHMSRRHSVESPEPRSVWAPAEREAGPPERVRGNGGDGTSTAPTAPTAPTAARRGAKIPERCERCRPSSCDHRDGGEKAERLDESREPEGEADDHAAARESAVGEMRAEAGGADEAPRQGTSGVQESARAEDQAARLLQRVSHRQRARKVGSVESHVRFCQFIWRRRRRAGCRHVWRPVAKFRCRGGRELASPQELEAQRERAAGVLAWYAQYVYLLRRLRSGQPVSVIHGCSGGGGAAEGTRRVGGAPVCIDTVDMPSCRRRFGKENFHLGNAMERALLLKLRRARRPVGAMYSPPCKAHSTQDLQKQSREPSLIEQSRDALRESGLLFSIENVVGAVGDLAEGSTLLRGAWFGLGVDRPRYFETNFPVHVDEALRGPGEELRGRTCLGWRRRMRRLDPFGRPVQTDCCHGNLHAVQGERPLYSTTEECACAMGVDEGHMPYPELAQSIPPDYAALVFAQMCMEQARAEFGAPVITYDQMMARPAWARRLLSLWLTGGGALAPDAGLAAVEVQSRSTAGGAAQDAMRGRGLGPEGLGRQAERLGNGCGEGPQVRAPETPTAEWAMKPGVRLPEGLVPYLPEVAFRELFHTHAGGYDRMAQVSGEPRWLDALHAAPAGAEDEVPEPSELCGLNTLAVPQSQEALRRLLEATQRAFELGVLGTRVTVVARRDEEARLSKAGFEWLTEVATSAGKRAAFTRGERRWCCQPSAMDYELVRQHMDPRDTGDLPIDKEAKQAMVWSDIPHDPERWRGKGMPADVEAVMVDGAQVPAPPGEPTLVECAQYAWDTPAALEAAISEADRAIIVGAMEYVPASQLDAALGDGYIHPWTMVQKGEKWRACHDYKCGTNRYVAPPPFELPTVWDAVAEMPRGAWMAKYDLRDGFWHCPVAAGSRCRLMMRHPGTGRLMWPKRLPFGYAASPLLFCSMTEAIAQRFRERMVGQGVVIHCFVDDYLLTGESKEALERGGRVLESIFEEFELAWAPHKHRGPAQVMEFLGLLISNVDGHRRVGLTEGRLAGLQRRVAEWMAREPRKGQRLEAEPKEVAKLLGHLVFASQCVHNGRAYMQAMLSAFAGLVIDWKRGCVTMTSGWRGRLRLEPAFWRDLRWWQEHLHHRNSVPIEARRVGEAAITATDASDWGCGELAWIDGQRAEVMLRFTEAERRRPINWRELFGVYRILAVWGPELSGRLVLLETDNMAARGAAAKGSSTSLDMQELVRRIVEICERCDIQVRLTHTPGVKLLRPDATSRGDPVEEPRHRLCERAFGEVWQRYGPFTEVVGAERAFARRLAAAGGAAAEGERMWLHPSHATVGSALRLVVERLAEGSRVSGAMVIPWAPDALWWPLLRHVDMAGAWGTGISYLESNRLGVWEPAIARRPALIVTFPRALGVARCLGVRGEMSPGPEYDWHEPSGVWVLRMLAGAVLYSPTGRIDGRAGGVVRLESRVAIEDLEVEVSEESVSPTAACAFLLQATKATQRAHAGGEGVIYEFDPTHKETYMCVQRAVRARNGQESREAEWAPWGYDLESLWEVPGTAALAAPITPAERRGAEDGSLLYSFDWRRAEADIARVQSQRRGSGSGPSEGEPSEGRGEARGDEGLVRPLVDAVRDEEPEEAEPEPAAAPAGRVSGEAAGRPAPCRYAGLRCEGCKEHFVVGKAMEPRGAGFVHVRESCRVMEAAHRLEALTLESGPARQDAPTSQLGSKLKLVRVEEKYSKPRLEQVKRCLSGKCDRQGASEIACLRECGQSLHAECAQIGHGHAKLGNLVCVDCRLKEMGLSAEAVPEDKRRLAEVTMLMALTRGRASTSHGYGEYDRIERLFTSGYGASTSRSIVAPRHGKESFIQFLTWFVLDADRALSLRSFVRSAGAFLTITGLRDWTKEKDVKAHVEELVELHGLESQPATHGTRRMLRLLLFAVLPRRCNSELLLSRARLLLVFEAVGGLRVGEAVSGGDFHGLLANNVCLLRERRTGAQSFEGRLEDSKTHRVRWFNMVGLTEGSHAPVGRYVAEYLKSTGVSLKRTCEGTYDVVRPDYHVVRVSLLGFPADGLKRLEKALGRSKVAEVRTLAGSSMGYARARMKLKWDVEEKAYVNVAGGAEASAELETVLAELRTAGLGQFARLAPGPLLRATSGGKRYTHMPLSPSSTYKLLHECMDEAYKLANADPGDPDPGLDLGGAAKPKWSNHSWRRYADKVARATMGETGATVVEIDRFFGWLEHHYEKLMQLHYAGREERVTRCGVTRMT